MSEEQEALRRGTLIRGIGGFYTAMDADGNEYTLRAMKKFRRERITPLVGDEVLFSPGEGEEHGWLEQILPRRTECVRPPVANVELLVIVVAPEPEPDLLLVDRLMVRAHAQGMGTVLAINKCDLDPSLAQDLQVQYAGAETPIHAVSAATGEGVEALHETLRGRLCCLAGQSGVGKSSLLSRMLGLELETGELSWKIRRGKNTTRHAELLIKDGLRVLDTAGFSLLELDGRMDPITLKEHWPELQRLEGQCRFQPCYHGKEPGCAATAAVEAGEIDPRRLERYRILLADVRQAWRKRYDQSGTIDPGG